MQFACKVKFRVGEFKYTKKILSEQKVAIATKFTQKSQKNAQILVSYAIW